MKIKQILALVVVSSAMIGCSSIKSRFFESAPSVSTSNNLNYNFAQPRRTPLSSDLVSRYKLSNSGNTSANRFTYYSASGNLCKTLSLSTLKAACLVNGQWNEAAPILVGNIPR